MRRTLENNQVNCRAPVDLWRERTSVALSRYQEAREASDRALAQRSDGIMPSSEGVTTTVEALESETAALREYVRVLRILTDLVVHRKPPPED